MADRRDGTAGLLHHVELAVSDFEASVSFWGWLLSELEYEPYQDWAGGRSWKRGPTYIVLVEADRSDPPFDRRAPGLDHVAFHVDSRAHVDAITEQIRDRPDATLLYRDRHPYAGGADHYAAYVETPEGIKAEVVAPDPGEPDGS